MRSLPSAVRAVSRGVIKLLHQLYIHGKWVPGTSGHTKPVINPANEQIVAEVAQAQAEDVEAALNSANLGFEIWREVSPWERSKILNQAACLIEERKSELARIMTLEQGKPLMESVLELDRTVDTFQWCAAEAVRTYGRLLPQRQAGMRQTTVKEPLGVVAGFSPWNFPAVLTARKIAAALGAGCAMIVKPSELAPGIAVGLVKACEDAGVPAGVLNLLFGNSGMVSEALIKSPIVKKISLTGSVPVGRKLSALAGEYLKPVTMELGGHAPVIVFEDANIRKAAELTAAFKFRNSGQVCLGVSRIFVQRSKFDEFLAHFCRYVEQLRLGDGLDANTTMGPLATAKGVESMRAFIADAKVRGARVIAGGDAPDRKGYFFNPTVLTDVPDNASIMSVEPFGPVAPVVPFDDYAEVIERANALDLGLAAYAFTSNLDTATRVTDDLEAGWIGVNNFSPALAEAPFGGMKDSGIGYEGGPEGFDAYCKTKFVSQSFSD